MITFYSSFWDSEWFNLTTKLNFKHLFDFERNKHADSHNTETKGSIGKRKQTTVLISWYFPKKQNNPNILQGLAYNTNNSHQTWRNMHNTMSKFFKILLDPKFCFFLNFGFRCLKESTCFPLLKGLFEKTCPTGRIPIMNVGCFLFVVVSPKIPSNQSSLGIFMGFMWKKRIKDGSEDQEKHWNTVKYQENIQSVLSADLRLFLTDKHPVVWDSPFAFTEEKKTQRHQRTGTLMYHVHVLHMLFYSFDPTAVGKMGFSLSLWVFRAFSSIHGIKCLMSVST